MTDTQWGAPLTGAQMRLLQLREGEKYQCLGPFKHTWGELERGFDDGWQDFEDGSYRLPANHPAYTLLEAGWLDGRDVRLRFGGDKAPDDWDGGDVLVNDTHSRIVKGYVIDQNNWSGNKQRAKIIAYIAKAEDASPTWVWYSNEFGVSYGRWKKHSSQKRYKLADVQPTEHDHGDTVTIAKMAEEEARNKFGKVMAPVRVLTELGLIKPEPTREELFWASQPNGGAHVTSDIKAWVREALEFERD